MKTNRNLLKEISKVIELDDNSCLVDLYGEHDENLSKLENNFGIHISYRGNILEFRGESEPCLEASQLVLKVYKKLIKVEKELIQKCLIISLRRMSLQAPID